VSLNTETTLKEAHVNNADLVGTDRKQLWIY